MEDVFTVEVFVGDIVVDVQTFDHVRAATDFASDKQDEGFKVRITP